MHYSPQNEECPMALNPFKACVAPRPIGWISTVSRDGIDNLAPFSQFQNLSYDPPMVMIAINQGGDEPDHVHRKDTVNNIESTGCFVYNAVPYDLKEQMNITASGFAPEEDEFEKAGFVNVTTNVKYDIVTGWLTDDGEVKSVSINGDKKFDSDDKYRLDAEVFITYHTWKKNRFK